MGIERVRGGYKETGGAQSQAYQGRVPGSTYIKTQLGTYTPYTKTGGAQGQAITAPGTGNEGFDMLLGKGKYAGMYNKWNRPSDTIILAKILESANLPKSANMMYNGFQQENHSTLTPLASNKNNQTLTQDTNLKELRYKIKDSINARKKIDHYFRNSDSTLKEEDYETLKDPIAGITAYVNSKTAIDESVKKIWRR